jgi:hypothetical protein
MAVPFLHGNMVSKIIYTDIPDTILSFPPNTPGLQDETHTFYFDLDQDGQNDFYFLAHYWEEWLSPSVPEYPNYVLSIKSTINLGVPMKLPEPCAFSYNADDTVQSGYWSYYGDIYVNVNMGYLNCDLPYQDRYIGLRLTEGADHYYGWIRLDASEDTLLFKDFAYNSNPNEIILAGQTETVGIYERNKKDNVQVYYDGNSIRINSAHDDFETYSILTIEGKKIAGGKSFTDKIVEFMPLRSGIYLVMLQEGDRSIAKKILIP